MPAPRSPRRATLALLLLALGAAGCAESAVAPHLPHQLRLEPGGTVTLAVGDTFTLRVSAVGGAGSPALTFRSSNPEVATVSSAGLVTARGSGSATISVVVTENSQVQAAVQVRVVEPVSAAHIVAVEMAEGQSVQPDSLAGRVALRVAFERGRAARLRVRMGEVVACEQDVTAAPLTGRQDAVCLVQTDRVNPETGKPTFLNGPVSLATELLDAEGRVLAGARVEGYVLRNRNTVVVLIDAARTARDSAGVEWQGGDLSVTAKPVLYDPGAEIARVTMTYTGAGGFTLTRERFTAPFQLTIPRDSLPVVDPEFRLHVTTVTAAGQHGPLLTTAAMPLDNLAPRPGALVKRDWVGAATPFAATYDRALESDSTGVGGVRARFFVGAAGLSAESLVEQGSEVERGDDLEASTAPLALALAARVCDALENCVTVPGFLFGLDLEAPIVSGISVADRAVNPGQDISLVVDDVLSGIGARPLEVSAVRRHAGSDAPVCGPTVEGKKLPGGAVDGACAPDTLAGVLAVPRETAGYYTYRIRALDRAGNLTEEHRREVLVDVKAPEIADLSAPAQPTAGADMTVSATLRDDLDLRDLSARLVFTLKDGSRLAVPFAPPAVLGTAFDETLSSDATGTATFPFVRSLTYLPAGSSTRSTVQTDSLRARVVDAAGNTAQQSRVLGSAAVTSDPFTMVSTVSASVSSSSVCTAGCQTGDATSTTIGMKLTGASGFSNPFEKGRVYFYRRGADGLVELLGSTTSVSRDDSGGQGTLTYTLRYTPAAGRTGAYDLFAVGVVTVSGTGYALKTEDVGVSLFTR